MSPESEMAADPLRNGSVDVITWDLLLPGAAKITSAFPSSAFHQASAEQTQTLQRSVFNLIPRPSTKLLESFGKPTASGILSPRSLPIRNR